MNQENVLKRNKKELGGRGGGRGGAGEEGGEDGDGDTGRGLE